MLRPTWERLSVGQWLRGERDKRLHHGLFRNESFVHTLKKLWLILTKKGVEEVVRQGRYFEDILDRQAEVCAWFNDAVDPAALAAVPTDLKRSVAVHVRLGDFPSHFRMPNSWYVALLSQVRAVVGHDPDIQVFSDGRDEEELAEILAIQSAHRVFYGMLLLILLPLVAVDS